MSEEKSHKERVSSKREQESEIKHVSSLTVDWVGRDIMENLLISHSVVEKLGFKVNSKLPEIGEKIEFSPAYAILQGKTYPPNSSAPLHQKGYRLMVAQYSFDGLPGGHVDHDGNNNGMPRAVQVHDGETVALVFGPGCGSYTETLTMYAYDGKVGSASGTGTIAEGSFEELTSGPDYVLIGQAGYHPQNHFATSATNIALRSIAQEYRLQTKERLYFGDMSLPLGGLFDVNADWASPHVERRNGTCADISAVTGVTMNFEDVFLAIVSKYTTNFILVGTGTDRHYHVRF